MELKIENFEFVNDIETLKKSYPEYYIKSVCVGKPTGNYSKMDAIKVNLKSI
jgi:hypothetical protein